MNSISILILLAVLCFFTLSLYLMMWFMDFLKTSAAQKINIIKTGLIFIIFAPIVFFALKSASINTVEVKSNLFAAKKVFTSDSLVQIQDEIKWPLYVVIGYLAGVLFCLVQLMNSFIKTKKYLAKSVRTTLNGESVLLSNEITSPLSFGVLKPQIFFPVHALPKWSSRDLELALAHEKNHLKENDPFWIFLTLLTRAFLFFSPWIYLLHKKFELEMEILCDQNTCAQAQASREEYGGLLLSLVPTLNNQKLLVTSITDSNIKRRILAMKSRTIQRPFLGTILGLGLISLGATAIAATSGLTTKKTHFLLNSKVFINGEMVSQPTVEDVAGGKVIIVQKDPTRELSLRMELVMEDDADTNLKDGIQINFNNEYSDHGKIEKSKIKIIAEPNKEATATIRSDNGSEFKIQLTVQRL